jgi:MFS family permease
MRSYLRVLRHRSFRLLFAGQAASSIGDQVVLVALALFVTRLTHSPTDVGLVLTASSLPMVVLLLFGGVWADRLRRNRIMLSCDIVRAAVHGLLAVLIFSGDVRVWEIVVIEVLFGSATAFFQPAYTGLLPQTVPEEEIQDARAITSASQNVAALVGPALATVLVLGVGAGEAFAFDAATFVLSAALLVGVRPRPRGTEQPQSTVWRELRAGWREVASRPWLWVTIVVFTFILMCVFAPWDTLGPTISRRLYGGVALFGILVSVEGAGAVVAAFVGVVWKPRKPLFTGLAMCLIWPVVGVAFALGAPVWLLVMLAFAGGFAWSLAIIWWDVAMAQHIPPSALSRVSAYDWMGSMALLPLGFLISGPLATLVGARFVLGAGSVIGIALLIVSLLPRSTRELGSAEQVPGEISVEARGEL